jgi:hypothetical protein
MPYYPCRHPEPKWEMTMKQDGCYESGSYKSIKLREGKSGFDELGVDFRCNAEQYEVLRKPGTKVRITIEVLSE